MANSLLFNKNGFNHVVCENCNFVFVNPILKQKVQEKILKNENSYTKVLKNKMNIKLDNLKFQYGLQKIKTNSKKKKILDFGTGYGIFLDNAKKFKWECYANEINKDCLKILMKKKIIIDNEFKKNFYDAITLWLVMEHLPYPNKLFRNIHRSLKKRGKILINVPNINSLSSLILKDKCTMFSGEQHINFFSATTLEKFLVKNNFKVLSSETIISDAGGVINFLNYNNRLKKENNRVYPFAEPDFIHKNMLGYTLLTIAEKI
jgi:2-polyprenyl-3-methyl-5-hydroxy-6-metoxy-1,4-benzoquinol methylase